VNKTELVKELAKQTDLSQAKAAQVVDALFDAQRGLIANHLKGGDKLVIPGFGSFFSRKREEREARNPATGKTIKVAAKNYPVFKPGKTLKDTVEG
jgi:DNA-binding protein HU-beta